MCQGHKKLLRVLYRIQKNPFMDLRLSLAEVSKVTEGPDSKCGKEDEILQLTSAGWFCQVKTLFGIG